MYITLLILILSSLVTVNCDRAIKCAEDCYDTFIEKVKTFDETYQGSLCTAWSDYEVCFKNCPNGLASWDQASSTAPGPFKLVQEQCGGTRSHDGSGVPGLDGTQVPSRVGPAESGLATPSSHIAPPESGMVTTSSVISHDGSGIPGLDGSQAPSHVGSAESGMAKASPQVGSGGTGLGGRLSSFWVFGLLWLIFKCL